ncbi:hypothetical protein LTS01_025094 [Friedmanniomyces endolithicus]|nr:hypothetical protein LTS01_025094 [Friedmanniomyces endolithicus]
MGFIACILSFFLQKESYGPVILVEKAAHLRRMTKNWAIHAQQDEVEVDLAELLKEEFVLSHPDPLDLADHPTYHGPLIFHLRHTVPQPGRIRASLWTGVSGLPYFGLIIGMFFGFLSVLATQPAYVRKLKANNNIPVLEWRLPLTMVGGIIFAAGVFWFGWGGYMKSTPWIVPTLAGLFLGFGIYTVFLQRLNYIIDAYLMFAASAIAANTIMRSIFGAVFPLFAYYMFEGIGMEWGMTFLGCLVAVFPLFAYYMFEGIGMEWGMTFLSCLATVFIPVPFVFYFYGKRIRVKSKFAPAPDNQQDKRRDEKARLVGDTGRHDGGSGDGQATASGSSGGSDEPEKKRKEEV